MDTPEVGTETGQKRHPHQWDAAHRSRLVNDPVAAIRRGTADGRAIYDLAVLMLAKLVGHDTADALVRADVVALAELMVRAGKMRLDPAVDPDKVIRTERVIELRKRRLGLVPARPRNLVRLA
jgi:hypothetical protein